MMKPTQKEQLMHNGPSEFISAALRNSLVLRTLMQHFSNAELLKLSLVNKLWNYEAKSLIRDRGIFPSFNSDESTCEELEAFASDLRHMAVVPFTGMNIQVCSGILEEPHECLVVKYGCDSSGSTGVLDSSHYDVILDRLPLKRLSLNIHKESANQNNCSAILLARKMLRHFSEVIEELSINTQHHEFIQAYNIPDLSFRRLTTLKITGSPTEPYGWEGDFVKVLVSRAPNLEQLETCGSLRFMDHILEGSSAKVVPSGGVDPFQTELPNSQFKRLVIEKLVVLTTSPNFSVEGFNIRIPALLQTYRTTLNTLHIDVKCIGSLMSYGLCLPNVTEFKIFMLDSLWDVPPACVRLFKAFDFTRTLPAVTKVGMNEQRGNHPNDEIQNFIEQGNAMLGEPVVDGSVNIKHLCVTNYFSEQTAPFLSDTFPNIEILSLEDKWSFCSMFLCGMIWKHWVNLKTIEATIEGCVRPERALHVDSSICGIFPEEVAELREKDEEFLKCVNIVSVMPSLGCFSELRTLKLTYVDLDADDVERNSRLLCSKVAGLLVFARCPNLSVTIQNDSPEVEMKEALDHMKPYASVVLSREPPDGFAFELEELEED